MVGLLCVGYATPGAFEGDEVHYLLAFADQCAQALERAGLYERVAAEHERLEAILQQLPAGVLLAEASSGRLMLGNDEVERIWRRPFVEGASLAEWCDHYGFHPENGRPYAPHEWPVARALRGEVVRGEEADILRGDGSPGTIVTNAAPLRNADGQIVAAVAAFADVTELADARRAAEVVRDRNALLAEASELLSTEGGEAQKLAAVVRLVVPRVAPYCSLLLADREGDQEVLRRVATLHADGAARARVEAISPVIRVTAGERLPLVRAYLDGEPVVFEQPLGELYRLITDDDDELAAFRSLDVRSGIAVPVGGRRGALGSLVLGYTTEGSPDPGTIEFATEFARRAGLVIENSRLASSRVAARRSAERALERTQRLQQVTAALAGAADVDGAVGVLVEQVAEALGAVGAWVALMGPDGSTLELAGQRGFAGGFAERYRVLSPDAPTPTALAARTGEAGWYGSVAECVELFPGLAADRRELGLEALAVLPLLHGGVVLGVVAVSFAEQREFDEADRELIANVVAQCAQALERARLHQAERRARVASELAAARTARLQALTARLSAAVTALDVCDAVIDEALAALGACVGAVALLTESGKDFRNVRVVGHDQPVLDVFPEFPGDAPTPIGDAVRRREPVVLETIPDRTALYPHLGDGRRPAGPDGALVALPLFVEGRALGGLGLLFPDERTFGPADVAFMETLAAQCAQALERARLYDREHRIAETLQRSLLPEHLPELPGVTLAARYQAGGAGLHVGGDWYDAIPLDGARVMLAVGDVVGRGIRAAAIMGQLRNGLRAYALEGYTPAEALHRLNRLADELGGGPFATACVAVLDPARRSMTLASAGHPPAVVIGEGDPRLLEAARSLPLAVSPTTAYVEAHVELPDGGAVAFYTDGLVEQRGESLDAGFARLMAAAASAPRDPERLADRLLALVPAEAADDVAILVAMLVAAPLHVAVPNEPEALAAARQELAAWLGRAGAGVQDVFDLTTAVGEALANAVEHARAPRERPILLDGRIDDGWAVLTVRDHGRWKPPVASDVRGFGLGLMRALTDDARVEPGDDGTVVTLRRALGNDRQEGLDR
jgi:GAF domain-containing protein/anti-sigma regulatory factor (Ser/Thr protein kinase)